MSQPDQFYRFDDFTSADFSTPYLIDPILPRGGIGLIYGKGGHGKTQLVFRMIKDLTEGRPFLGLWPVEQCSVLFIQADMPDGLFQERCRLAEPDLKAPEHISIWPTKPLNILDPEHRSEVSQQVSAADADLVVYDTLHKLHYEDENESRTPRKVYDAWKEAIGSEDKEITSILIHHARKGFFYKGDFKDGNEDFRGHTSWKDDSDMAIRVRKDREQDDRTQMSFTRLRCKKQKSVPLQFNPETLIIEPVPGELQAQQLALTYLRDGGSSDTLIDYLQEFGFTRRHGRRIRGEMEGIL